MGTGWWWPPHEIEAGSAVTDRASDDYGDRDERTHHNALVGLHALSRPPGAVAPDAVPGYRPSTAGESLRTVAEADESVVPMSARLGALHRLARADFPQYDKHQAEYRQLVASVADRRGLDPDAVLSDLKESARGEFPFAKTASGQALPHHEVAFIGEDVCTTRRVDVGGLSATWVFSEFETDAPFGQIADWVDPRSWPARGPMMFKRMDLVGASAPIPISDMGDDHWHGVFHEEVQLVSRLNTLLHCDYWRAGSTTAGMTYKLDLSLDNEIDVDRGFLLVNDLGPVRRVKALKIVGFSTDLWDGVATMVCPFWTDWIRGAVQGGSASTPKPPTNTPGGGSGLSLGEGLEAWMTFFSDAAQSYLDLASDVTSRAASGGYTATDGLADGTRYWSQLAKDWARAWSYGLEALDEVAREGLDAGLAPPGSAQEPIRGMATALTRQNGPVTSEATVVPVAGIAPGAHLVLPRLVSIEAGGAELSADELSVTIQTLPDGTSGVLVSTTNTSAAPGLYVGDLTTAQGQVVAPVQLYVARAAEVTSS